MKSGTPIRDVTAAARSGLSGNWGLSIGDTIVYVLLLFGVTQVPFASLIFAGPLIVGLHIYFLQTVRRRNTTFPLLFAGFERFGTAWRAYILVKLILCAWVIPIAAAGAALQLLVHPDPATVPPGAMMMAQVGVALLMAIVLIAVQMRYAMVLYVAAEDQPVPAKEAVRRGVELMSGNYGRLFGLWLRFFGWYLLCLLTFGIGFIWLFPYISAAMAAFYDDLSQNG